MSDRELIVKLSRESGTTLIEVLITMSLSLLIFGLLAIVYLATEHQHHFQELVYSLDSDLSLSMQILEHELQLAGYVGCVAKKSTELNIPSMGLDDTRSAKLTIRHRSLLSSLLQKAMTSNDALEISADIQVSEGELLLISDCESAEIFRVAKVLRLSKERQILLSREPLKKCYGQTAEVGYWEENSYFIAKTGRKTPRGKTQYGLFKEDIKGHKAALVEDITKLNFHLLVNNANSPVDSRTGISIGMEAERDALVQKEYGLVAMAF